MEAREIRIAAAGCFAVIMLASAVTTRFDVIASFANVFSGFGLTEDEAREPVKAVEPIASDDWKSGFNKYATIIPAATSSDLATSSEPMTDSFAKVLFESYLRNRAAGKLDTEEARTSFAQTYIKAMNAQIQEQKYTGDTLKTDDNISMKKYLNEVMTIILQSGGLADYELEVFQKLMERQDFNSDEAQSEIDKLSTIARVYGNMETGLRDMTIPTSMRGTHVQLLNAVQAVRSGTEGMSVVNVDPIRPLLLLNTYLEGFDALQASFLTLRMQGKLEDVYFAEDEPGYALMNLMVTNQ